MSICVYIHKIILTNLLITDSCKIFLHSAHTQIQIENTINYILKSQQIKRKILTCPLPELLKVNLPRTRR